MNEPRENNHTVNALNDLRRAVTILWWDLFNWIALLSWKKLFVVWVVLFVLFGIARTPQPAVVFFFASIAIKVLAGGKMRAEVQASEATARANVEALERRLLEAQINALQAQVEPHFLFNTLALIGQLIETDPPQAAKIHASLVQYLRTAIPQMREQGGATLGRQADLAKSYLNIMQARMKERLTVEFDIPEELKSAPFPPMMLQTLVENSIKHGLEPKPEGGHINVNAMVVGDILRVAVTDNGMGFDLHADDGVGLANIRERLKILYNGRARLMIEIPPQGGARTVIHLPYEFAGAGSASSAAPAAAASAAAAAAATAEKA